MITYPSAWLVVLIRLSPRFFLTNWVDCVLIVLETIHSLKSTKQKDFLFKLAFKKAFDSLNFRTYFKFKERWVFVAHRTVRSLNTFLQLRHQFLLKVVQIRSSH